jgi:serine phosphatase RsbU (regulator of sigma subunit)/CHASE3 domain sensor protein
MWVCAGVLVLLVAGVGAGFAWVNVEGGRTVSTLHDQLDPALDAVRELVAAVRGNESAYLGYLLTGEPTLLAQSQTEAAHVRAAMVTLQSYAGAVPEIRTAMPVLGAEERSWLSVVQPTGQVAGSGSGSGSGSSANASAKAHGMTSSAVAAQITAASQNLLADTQRLGRRLATRRDSTWTRAFHDRGTAFVLVEVFAGVLLALLVGLALLASRRVMSPLAALELRMHQASEGMLESLSTPRRSWLTGLTLESERLRVLLKEYRWDSRRDREALELEGQTSIGMSQILTRMGMPGPGVDAHGDIVAAHGVIAGDFLDMIGLSDGTTALVLGDISGHGVEAGLIAAQAKSAVVSALRLGYSAQAAVNAAWSVLMYEEERFVTLAVVVINPVEQAVLWVNAGHEPPFLRRADGGVERLDCTGPLVSSLAAVDEVPWALRRTSFRPGDALVLITDGLTEARNEQGQELGDQAVAEILRNLEAVDPPSVVRALYLAAERHGTDWQRDDVTILAAVLRGDQLR